MEARHLRIVASLDAVAQAGDFIYQAALDAGLDERAAHHCCLAVDEACTNVIEHTYQGNSAEQAIDVFCHKQGDTFIVTVTDDGPAFNPLNMPNPNPSASLNEREPGGWGVFFIKKLMDKVAYEYSDSRNCLIMVKKIEPVAEMTSVAPSFEVAPVNHKIWQIALSGTITTPQTVLLERALQEHLSAGHKFLILEMSNVEHIDSAGLKVLVGAWQRAREKKGNLVLVGLKQHIREVLQLIGLDLVFPISETQAQAVELMMSKRN
jgi:serine/threonine-protein kinase RsbW